MEIQVASKLSELQEPAKLDLSKIINLSQNKSFVLPEFKNISSTQRWAPETITPWLYLPSYRELPEDVRIRYNQHCAVAINEIFSLFEMNFLVKILESFRGNEILDSKALLVECLVHFCAEEKKHSEMFWQLSEAAATKYYPKRDFYFVPKASFASRTILETITKYPQTFLIWVWMAVFFEERTLKYSKEYISQATNHNLDTNFVLAHRLHMIEEVRHVRLDAHLIETFYKQQPQWKRKMASTMMRKVIKDFSSPRRLSIVVAKELKSEFPESQKTIDKIISELPLLRKSKDFQEMLFGVEATGRTRELMAQYPEFDGIWDFMKK